MVHHHIHHDERLTAVASDVRRGLGARVIVLIGMMGAGKSSVGRRLARTLGIPFLDADTEIEKAAGMSIPEIFEKHGEPYFRAGERRVVARLLEEGPSIVATGGGAWMDPETRQRVEAGGISVWLKADLDVLLKRVKRRGNRPLLNNGDQRATLEKLLAVREPVYADADLEVLSRDVPHEVMVEEMLAALSQHLAKEIPQS